MRSNALGKTLAGLVAVAGIAAGTVATAGVGYAAPVSPSSTSVVSQPAAAAATHNFGLTTAEAKNVQRFLAEYWDYNDSIDGQLGTNSWKAMQRFLSGIWGYTGAIDGDPGTNTVKALQRMLAAQWGYTGAIDGDPGSGTQAAFKRFADS
ncbi:peptidoglycan-binding protein [Streptomyces sp. NBC_00252]|uniref:peptidoglycan-binding domain-containing protein n=1 Tax=Streptomyces sp. NBC_00252 TaxID=2975691 RepID=UPI002E2A3ADD|nr:peptidoglycan-binding protein [Streptomyces sp. NBC_00252]